MMKRLILSAALAAATATGANAAITIDGVYDAAYGAATAVVNYDPAASQHNFGAPTNENHATGYKIYLDTDADYVYGYLEAFGPNAGAPPVFANLYFGTTTFSIGFEITNDRAFRPGGPAATYLDMGSLLDYATTANSIEFRISNAAFTGDAASLYSGTPDFPEIGDYVALGLSQSFGYSVAGGSSYGDRYLGVVQLGAVPEPATWAMMVLGFMGAGAGLRRRGAKTATA